MILIYIRRRGAFYFRTYPIHYQPNSQQPDHRKSFKEVHWGVGAGDGALASFTIPSIALTACSIGMSSQDGAGRLFVLDFLYQLTFPFLIGKILAS